MPKKSRSTRQAAASARSENDAGSVSGVDDSAADSWAGHMEAEEQQLPGAGNHGPGAASLNVPTICSLRSVLGVEELLPMPAQASQAGYTNPLVYTGRARCGQRPTSHQHGSQSGYNQSHAARRSRSLTSAWQDVNVLAQHSFFWRGSHDHSR